MTLPTKAQARDMRAVAQEVGQEVRPECPQCGRRMVKNGKPLVTGSSGGRRQVWMCQGCGKTKSIKLEKGG